MTTAVAVSETAEQTAARHAPRAADAVDPRRWLALAVMTLGAFMVLVDTTVVNVAIPSIRNSLHTSFADTQ